DASMRVPPFCWLIHHAFGRSLRPPGLKTVRPDSGGKRRSTPMPAYQADYFTRSRSVGNLSTLRRRSPPAWPSAPPRNLPDSDTALPGTTEEPMLQNPGTADVTASDNITNGIAIQFELEQQESTVEGSCELSRAAAKTCRDRGWSD